MRISILSFLFSLLVISQSLAQHRDSVALKTATGTLYGTLTMPDNARGSIPVVLIIAGSGPTDRNGNNAFMTSNSLRMLSDSLAAYGVASLSFDKRGIAASKQAGAEESKLLFTTYVEDAKGWIRQLKKDGRFSRIYIAGHSEGSLIGMMALKGTAVAGFISIAGAGKPADQVMMAQLAASGRLTKEMLDSCRTYLSILRSGGHIDYVPAGFYHSLFRPSVQPYVNSWIRLDPRKEIASLKVPALVIQGTTDIQIDTPQARALVTAYPSARLSIIPGMNHIMKEAPEDIVENSKTYTDPSLPIKTELVQAIVSFIKRGKK
jgi:pimeloyl-ACP methyl ester carboxylesterase